MPWADADSPSSELSPDERSDVDLIRSREEERLEAIRNADVVALEAICHPDLRYTHISGRIEDRDTFLGRRAGRPVALSREDMSIILHGDIALTHGTLLLDVSDLERGVRTSALQVWTKDLGSWQLVAYQSTRTL